MYDMAGRLTAPSAASRGTFGPPLRPAQDDRGLMTHHAVRLQRACLLEGRDALPQGLVVREARLDIGWPLARPHPLPEPVGRGSTRAASNRKLAGRRTPEEHEPAAPDRLDLRQEGGHDAATKAKGRFGGRQRCQDAHRRSPARSGELERTAGRSSSTELLPSADRCVIHPRAPRGGPPPQFSCIPTAGTPHSPRQGRRGRRPLVAGTPGIPSTSARCAPETDWLGALASIESPPVSEGLETLSTRWSPRPRSLRPICPARGARVQERAERATRVATGSAPRPQRCQRSRCLAQHPAAARRTVAAVHLERSRV